MVRLIFAWIALISYLATTCLEATVLKPWFDPDKALMIRPSYTYRRYTAVDTCHKGVKHHCNDNFTNFSALIANDDSYSAELEYLAADTSQHPYSGRATSLTFRYLILNDVIGDPLSVIPGITFRYIQPRGLDDISLFYHGPFEAEPTISFGQEFICREFWTSRWWSVIGAGIADRGSPWIKADFNWEHNCWDRHQFRLFIHSLWGLGNRCIKQVDDFSHFPGYASINHQSIDLGLGYRFSLEEWGELSLEYYHRAYAKNGPLHVNAGIIKFIIPFELPWFFGCFADWCSPF